MYLTLLLVREEHSSVFFYKPLPWGPCSYHGFLFGRVSLLHRTGIRSVSMAAFSHCSLKNTKDSYAEVKNYGFISVSESYSELDHSIVIRNKNIN